MVYFRVICIFAFKSIIVYCENSSFSLGYHILRRNPYKISPCVEWPNSNKSIKRGGRSVSLQEVSFDCRSNPQWGDWFKAGHIIF
jgi:hypothetical protein